MSHTQPITKTSKYYTIIDGSFRTQVPSDSPKAIARDWETKDGKSGTKYEEHHQAIFGEIMGVNINDGDYGKTVNVYLDKDEDGLTPVLSFGCSSRYGSDFLKKLPNLKTGVVYRFLPYDITGDNEKRNVGISINTQNDEGKFAEKTTNYFYDGEKSVNGFPEPDEEDKSDWAFYFKKVEKFLIKHAEEKELVRFNTIQENKGIEYPEEAIKAEDIPF